MAETKRDKLRQALLDAAENRIVARGPQKLTAREVTKDAGCALGSLYNAYSDLDGLILHVNIRTLTRLRDHLSAAADPITDPKGKLLALAEGYCGFVAANWNAWSALFDYPFAAETEIPEAVKEGQAVLIDQITWPLMALTQQPPEQAARHARMLFSAVHGIVKLSLEQRFAALKPEELRQQLRHFLEVYLAQL